jgi:hypothetical protein
LHVSVVHTLLSLHTVGEPAWQMPPEHVSPLVHAFPSLHAVPLGATVGAEHCPVVGEQVPGR